MAITKDCGTYTLDSSGSLCSQDATCPTDSTFSLSSSIAFSKAINECVSSAQHDCVTGTVYGGQAKKCQTYPTCANGTTYNSQTGGCCPTTALNCHQITGDTTTVMTGVPAQYCSPDNCQNDTTGMDTINDTVTGSNDKTNDGAKDSNGNCLGQIYLFNGNDLRCRLYDDTAMTTSIAELVGQLVLMCTGVGEALMATQWAMEVMSAISDAALAIGMTTAQAANAATTIMSAAINTTLSTANNLAATTAVNGNLSGVGSVLSQGALSFGTSIGASMLSGMASGALSGIKNYAGLSNGGGQDLLGQVHTITDADGATTTFTQTAATGATNVDALQLSGDMDGYNALGTMTAPDGSTYTPYQLASATCDNDNKVCTGGAAMLAVDGKTGLVTWNAYTTVKTSSPSDTYFGQLKGIASQYGNQAAAMASASMLSQYTPTKCCYPDKLSASCLSAEIQEATEQKNGLCHIVGSYCSKKTLFICMTEKQTSCCFSSKLARIIQEQGRPQLQSFSNKWGSAKNPDCRGFTPEEFQSLNFATMDLSEYISDVTSQVQQVTPLLQDYMNSVGTNTTQKLLSSPNLPKGAN
jgi:hypothetical protein